MGYKFNPFTGKLDISGAAGAGVSNLVDLLDVDQTDTPVKNDVVKFDGTQFQFVPYTTSFTFSIASFTATGFLSGTRLIGSGEWLAIGAISFSATYNNGSPTDAHIDKTSPGWISDLALDGATLNTEAIDYPSVGASRSVVLHATDGTDSDTETITATFYNYIYYGKTSKADTYLESDIEGLANSTISNDHTQTWSSVTMGAGEYWCFAWPARLAQPQFYDNTTGFALDIQDPETVSVTNSAGYTEDYCVLRSTYANLGALIVRTA